MLKTFLSGTSQDVTRTLQNENRKLQEQEAAAKASELNLPYINLHGFPLDLNVLGMFRQEEAKSMESLPFFVEHADIRIGTYNPDNVLLKQKIAELSRKSKIQLYFISKASFEEVSGYYSKIKAPRLNAEEIIEIKTTDGLDQELQDLKAESGQDKKTPSDILHALFGNAMLQDASDIHMEPEERFVKLRYRIDGVLQDVLHLDTALQKAVTSRIKIIAKLKINVENVPQDGRITFYYLGKPIDVRVSTLPSAYGEGIVMRLLGTNATNLTFKDLGFWGKAHDVIERELAKPNGMIITTGPTGSGKTTSLYAFLNELNEPGVKIITLEDPVEYKLEGIQQTPIDHNVDFDFAKGLRAILRQDPDIIMVGEIRDTETAETAMQAALTGHVVLSTLHTNDAAGAIPRLINMGVKPFIIAPALNAVIAQRLVRRLCEFCKEPVTLQPELNARAIKLLESIPSAAGVKLPMKMQFYHSKGCDKCHGTGYKGRIGVYEVIEVNEAMEKLILGSALSMGDVRKQAVSDGMVTMAQDGLQKALEGITDVEEVFRVAGEEE